MKNIYLVGFMATGKTWVGKILAQRLGREFVETDELIEQEARKSIAEIFRDEGEVQFRAREAKLLAEVAGKTGLVVSCGGGLICDDTNLRRLKQSGLTFCLSSSAAKIYQRVAGTTQRPLLNCPDPLNRIKELLAARLPYYQQADYVIPSEAETPQEVADNIMAILKTREAV